jgi:hypothetical protein
MLAIFEIIKHFLHILPHHMSETVGLILIKFGIRGWRRLLRPPHDTTEAGIYKIEI